jgi:ferredoxin-NADP reductase
MEKYIVKVLNVKKVTHNVHAFTVENPAGYSFLPGQATELSIVKEGWQQEKRPFTFTSLPTDETLEFTIKSYSDHDGVTNQLNAVLPGDSFEIGDAWGTIEYKGEGVFLAGGAGVTPFISILRDLYAKNQVGNNKLIFSNRTSAGIILKEEFEKILGPNFINTISGEELPELYHGRINKDFLRSHIVDFDQPFYVCGPDAFTSTILEALEELGAHPDALVFEK